MIGVSVRRDRGGAHQWFAEGLLDELRDNGARAVEAGRDVAVREMERLLRLRTGGPAPAGEPPAKVTGDLLDSLKTPPAKRRRNNFLAKIHFDHPGANRLEHGYRDARGVTTAPHPFADRAISAKSDAIEAAMERAL